jgi:hypothetical protein
MLKKIGFRLLVLAAMVSFLFIAQAQTEEQGWKKTITLPSGEVVCDLNGEWVVYAENYGPWSTGGTNKSIIKITQQGSSFVGVKIRMIESGLLPEGSVIIKGELDKDGFKEVQLNTLQGFLDCKGKGKISDDGNKIIVDDGEKLRETYTRK